MLSAEVAQAYVDLRDRQQRIALIRESAELEEQILTLTQQRREQGVASDLYVERIRTQVENTRATLIPLDAQLTDSLDHLAVLTGREPGRWTELAASAPLPAMPETVAVGDPSTMLKRRPDIRAAERRLASTNAQIGERVADWFPKVRCGRSRLQCGESRASDPQEQFQLDWRALSAMERVGFRPHARRVEAAELGIEEAEAKYERPCLARCGTRIRAITLRASTRECAKPAQRRGFGQSCGDSDTATVPRRHVFRARLARCRTDPLFRATKPHRRRRRPMKDYVAVQKSLGLGWQQRLTAPDRSALPRHARARSTHAHARGSANTCTQ